MKIVFEIGPTYTSLEEAIQLTQIVKDSGADAVKVQLLNPDDILHTKNLKFNFKQFNSAGKVEDKEEYLYEILMRRFLSDSEWIKFFDFCEKIKIDVFATITSRHYLHLALNNNVKEMKIASGDITHHQLIREVAQCGLPIHLDTGRASIPEIEDAVKCARAAGNQQIYLHYCPPGYPAENKDVHLNILNLIRSQFQVGVGYSDHSPGIEMNLLAVALGVDVIEKTLTLSKKNPGPEHMFSLEPIEAPNFIKKIKETLSYVKGENEELDKYLNIEPSLNVRRSIYASKKLVPGEIITLESISFKRPGIYMSAKDYESLIGKTLRREIEKNSPILTEDIV